MKKSWTGMFGVGLAAVFGLASVLSAQAEEDASDASYYAVSDDSLEVQLVSVGLLDESDSGESSQAELASVELGGGFDYDDGKGDCCIDECNDCCDCSCYFFGPAEPWTMLRDNPCRSWNVGGWVAMGATTNHHNPVNPPAITATPFGPHPGGNLPQTFNYRNDEFQLNQAYGYIERPADNGGCGWAIGGRVDVLYGEDYIFTQAAGLETRPNFVNHWNIAAGGGGILGTGRLGLALPQAYAEVAYNNLRVKAGHFYTIIGYETVTAPDNFFYSHAWTMQFSEPFTHSGILADLSVGQWTLYGGVVNGWDKFDAVSDRAAILAGASFTPCDEKFTATFAIISGDEDGTNEVAPGTALFDGNRTMFSFVLDYNLNDCWEYVLQTDFAWQENGSIVAGQDAEWYAVNQYLFYTLNDCWKAGVRFEWMNDDDGARISGLPGHYYEATAGLNYKPHANIVIRPEVRYNWYETHDGNALGIPNGVGPFLTNDPPLQITDEQFTAGVDAIITF